MSPPPHPALSPSGGEGCVVDPVTLEIIRGSLGSTIRDMELLMERCAMSPFIKEKKDYFVGVFDTRGRIVACHISGSGPGMLTPILRAYPLESMRAGDVYWFNDPYLSDGAVQHHQDMVFVMPVFHAGAVVAFATFEAGIAQTAERTRALFLELVPEGAWRFHDYLDSDGGVDSRPHRIELALDRRGDHVRLDGSGSDDQARGPINF